MLVIKMKHNILMLGYKLKKLQLRHRKIPHSNNNIIFLFLNTILMVTNIIYLVFNTFPNLNPNVTDVFVRASNGDTSLQIELANMYYAQGEYEKAQEKYLDLISNPNPKIAGAAYNNIAIIYNNYNINYKQPIKVEYDLPTDNTSNNTSNDITDIIYIIYDNLHKSEKLSNETATENLAKLNEVYSDPTVSGMEKLNDKSFENKWEYYSQTTSHYALVSTNDVKYILVGVKVSSSMQKGHNSYTYTYNVYKRNNSYLGTEKVHLECDMSIIGYTKSP